MHVDRGGPLGWVVSHAAGQELQLGMRGGQGHEDGGRRRVSQEALLAGEGQGERGGHGGGVRVGRDQGGQVPDILEITYNIFFSFM